MLQQLPKKGPGEVGKFISKDTDLFRLECFGHTKQAPPTLWTCNKLLMSILISIASQIKVTTLHEASSFHIEVFKAYFGECLQVIIYSYKIDEAKDEW